MFDYLPKFSSAQVSETLSMKPANSIPSTGDFLQTVNETDGGNPKTTTMKTTPEIYVPLQFKGKTKAQRDVLIDLYTNPLKAMKEARSFTWQHPETEENYVAKFASAIIDTEYSYGRYDISVTIKVIGRL